MKKKIMFVAVFAAFALFAIMLSPQSALARQPVATSLGSIWMNCPVGYGAWMDGYMGQGSMIITWVFTDEDRVVGGSCGGSSCNLLP